MAKKPKIKVVCRRGKTLVIVAIAAVIVLSIAAMAAIQAVTDHTRQQTEALRTEAYELEQESSRLQQYIDELGTIKGILRIAQEKLGLVEPDSVIFDVE